MDGKKKRILDWVLAVLAGAVVLAALGAAAVVLKGGLSGGGAGSASVSAPAAQGGRASTVAAASAPREGEIPDAQEPDPPAPMPAEGAAPASGPDAPEGEIDYGKILEKAEIDYRQGERRHAAGTVMEPIEGRWPAREAKERAEEERRKEEQAAQEASVPKLRVFIDPGHGGDGAGPCWYDGKQHVREASGKASGEFPTNSLGTTSGTSGGGASERDFAYAAALKAQAALEAAGHEAVLSRGPAQDGSAIGNWDRGRLAASYDAWVAIHADGGGGQGVHCVAWDSDPESESALGDAFLAGMKEAGWPLYTASGYPEGWSGNSSGKLQGPQKYVSFGGDPDRILYIEAGFMDDEEDLERMLSEEGQEELAECIAGAVGDLARREGAAGKEDG